MQQPSWHGDNYIRDVSVTGPIDNRTSYVVHRAELKPVVRGAVIDRVDDGSFNLEVDFMRGVISTTENIAVDCWRGLEPRVAPALLVRLLLGETPNNYVEYEGR